MKYNQDILEKNKIENKNYIYGFACIGVFCVGIIFFCLVQLYCSLSVPIEKAIKNSYLFEPYLSPQILQFPFYIYIMKFVLLNIFVPLFLFMLPFFLYGYKYYKDHATFEVRYKKANDFRLFFQMMHIIVYLFLHLLILHNSVDSAFLFLVEIFSLAFVRMKLGLIICFLFYNTGAILSKYILLCNSSV